MGTSPSRRDVPHRVGGIRVEGWIGAGGMGDVYKGRSGEHGLVAVKVMRRELADDVNFRRRFRREVSAAAQVTGPYTARVVDADVDADLPWFASEYIQGPNLNDYVNSHGPFAETRLVALGSALLDGLRAIHAAEIIHRDFTPNNILLAPDGPKIVDFGIAYHATSTTITHQGGLLGTPMWMAPEQVQGRAATEATDVFAWGAVMTFAATGRYPFGEGPSETILYRVVHDPPDLNGVPEPIRGVLASALEKDPQDRPDLHTLQDRLRWITPDQSHASTLVSDAADQPWAIAEPLHGSQPLVRPPKRHTTMVVSAAAVLLLVAGFLVSSALTPQDHQAELGAAEDLEPTSTPTATPDTEQDTEASPEPDGDEPATSPPTPEPTETAEADDTETDGEGPMSPEELAETFGPAVFRVEAEGCGFLGTGTAFAIDAQHLVTNQHVVDHDTAPMLVDPSGELRSAEVVGWRTDPDIAVLRVEDSLPVTLEWAETANLREGQPLVGLGYPLPDHDFTVTPGTILSFQTTDDVRAAIRTDAALDRGNSGGPVLNELGQVVGVTTSVVTTDGGIQAVPLLFTPDAVHPTVEALVRGDQTAPEADCEGAARPNIVPDDWDAPPDPDVPVQTYGDDAELDGLWDACAEGDMTACDTLYRSSPFGSDYEWFADTCGERNQPGTWCADIYTEEGTDVATLPPGLFCRDLHAEGYSYAEAMDYWFLEGQPDRMDASLNGIPCQTVYPADEITQYWGWTPVNMLPAGLFCRDLHAAGYSYAEAMDYWFLEGQPDRMDASLNGIPCQTVYPADEIAWYWDW